MEQPYRSPAKMPVEVKEMTKEEMNVRVWLMVLVAVVGVTSLCIGHSIFNTIHTDNTAILKAQIEASPLGAEAAKSRYLEAKALSDKAMFEEMAKHPPAPAK